MKLEKIWKSIMTGGVQFPMIQLYHEFNKNLKDVGDEVPDVPQEQCDLVLLPDEVVTFRKEPEVSHAMAPKKGRDGR